MTLARSKLHTFSFNINIYKATEKHFIIWCNLSIELTHKCVQFLGILESICCGNLTRIPPFGWNKNKKNKGDNTKQFISRFCDEAMKRKCNKIQAYQTGNTTCIILQTTVRVVHYYMDLPLRYLYSRIK